MRALCGGRARARPVDIRIETVVCQGIWDGVGVSDVLERTGRRLERR